MVGFGLNDKKFSFWDFFDQKKSFFQFGVFLVFQVKIMIPYSNAPKIGKK